MAFTGQQKEKQSIWVTDKPSDDIHEVNENTPTKNCSRVEKLCSTIKDSISCSHRQTDQKTL